jgi:hypothetical protein
VGFEGLRLLEVVNDLISLEVEPRSFGIQSYSYFMVISPFPQTHSSYFYFKQ